MKAKGAILIIFMAVGVTVVAYWAINTVNNEVLNAFKLTSDGMANSNQAMDLRNQLYLDSLEQIYDEHPEITQAYADDAILASDTLDGLITYIEGLRQLLIDESGSYVNNDTLTGNLRGKKNYDVTTRLMVDQRRGDTLQQKIMESRKYILALDSWAEADVAYLERTMHLTAEFNGAMQKAGEKIGKRTWAAYLFDHVPVIAANTIFMKIQGDAKNSQTLVIERLYDKALVAVEEANL